MAKYQLDWIVQLKEAIRDYDYPAKYLNFDDDVDATHDQGMAGIEQLFQYQLRSGNWVDVKHGLANVIHWAFARFPGRQAKRRNEFLTKVRRPQIDFFMRLVAGGSTPELRQFFALKLPVYSGIATASKVLMFLDPDTRATFDSKIAQVQYTPTNPHRLIVGLSIGQLTNNAANRQAYNDWCEWCSLINERHFENRYRAADVERGMFYLVSDGKLSVAREIYRNA